MGGKRGHGCNNEKRKGGICSNGLGRGRRLHVKVIWGMALAVAGSISKEGEKGEGRAHGVAHAKMGFWRLAFEHVTKEGTLQKHEFGTHHVLHIPFHAPLLSTCSLPPLPHVPSKRTI